MSGRDYDQTEETLRELSQRRKILEKKTALRLATMDEFKVVKNESLTRLKELLRIQNNAAKERNDRLLYDINALSISAINSSMNITLNGKNDIVPASKGKDILYEAKKTYYSKVELLLPMYKQNSIMMYEAELKKAKLEKKIVEERRLRLQYEIEKEEKIKAYIEQERRGLALSLALEQRDQLEVF